MSLSVKLEDFQGPLDLLLKLITEQKINILDIPISEITEQYNQIISSWTFEDIPEACDYLELSARLIKIKSKFLLPKKSNKEEEEDPRIELAQQLFLYSIYKRISEFLDEKINNNLYRYTKDPTYIDSLVITKPKKVNIKILEQNMRRIIISLKEIERTQVNIKPELYTVEEKMDLIINTVFLQDTTLRSLLFENTGSEEIITTFLALLELYKNGKVDFEQIGPEIRIKRA